MGRDRPSSGASLWIAFALLAGIGALAFSELAESTSDGPSVALASEGEGDSAEHCDPEDDGARAIPLDARSLRTGASEPGCIEEELARDPVERARSVHALLEQLARSLEDAGGSRIAWESEIRSVAGSLGPDSRETLLAAVADSPRALSERVAASELLRALEGMPGGSGESAIPEGQFPPEGLVALRRAAQAVHPFPLRFAVACRSLAAFGSARDLAWLVEALVDPDDIQMRPIAAWALQSARDERVVADIADIASRSEDPALRESAVIALDGWLRERKPCELSPLVGEEVARSILGFATDPESPPGLRLRCMPVLGALGGPHSREALLGVLRDPKASPPLARAAANGLLDSGSDPALAPLDELTLDAELCAAHPLEVAEVMVVSAKAGESNQRLRTSARAVLRAIVEGEGAVSERRRAVVALASLQDPEDQEWFEHAARTEQDAFVRERAARAIERRPE